MDDKVTHFSDTVVDFINCFRKYFLFYKLVDYENWDERDYIDVIFPH